MLKTAFITRYPSRIFSGMRSLILLSFRDFER